MADPRTIAFLPSRSTPGTASATFRVLAKGDLDADAALASTVDCPPPPRSLTPPRRPLSNQRGRAARGCDAAEIVRFQQRASASVTARPRLDLAPSDRCRRGGRPGGSAYALWASCHDLPCRCISGNGAVSARRNRQLLSSTWTHMARGVRAGAAWRSAHAPRCVRSAERRTRSWAMSGASPMWSLDLPRARCRADPGAPRRPPRP